MFRTVCLLPDNQRLLIVGLRLYVPVLFMKNQAQIVQSRCHALIGFPKLYCFLTRSMKKLFRLLVCERQFLLPSIVANVLLRPPRPDPKEAGMPGAKSQEERNISDFYTYLASSILPLINHAASVSPKVQVDHLNSNYVS